MKKLILAILVFASVTQKAVGDDVFMAPPERSKHRIYFLWGYTRAWYSQSTIHFKDLSNKYHPKTGNYNNYDFTVYNVSAHDRPKFVWQRDIINFSIPQFVCHMGIYLNDKWDFELSYDHTKYVVDDWQHTKITGQIFGKPVNGDTIMEPNHFLHFEHTDGANFAMFSPVRKFKLLKKDGIFSLNAVLKPGAGFVYPRTDVTLFGEELNNNWHIAGWIVGAEGGVRMRFWDKLCLEITGKYTYANYARCLVLGAGNGRASHQIRTTQFTVMLGYQFKGKKLKP